MKKIKYILFFLLAVIIMPLLVLSYFDSSIEDEYSETYYGELDKMYERLKETEGSKIVIIGNSNVAFGVESKFFEELISDFDSPYSVVNFGLYGSIGTKAMLELAENYINKDDIVILVPEEYSQSMSLYFSAKELWYSLDGNRKMLKDLSSTSKEALFANYADFVSKKYASHKNKTDYSSLGIYASSSFDDHCDLTQYPREYNILLNDYDENNLIDLSLDLIDDDFIDYINEYNENIVKKGAKMYYSFSPMNKESVINSQEEIDAFYLALKEKLSFPVISDINNYILDKEWFYDSNFHLNESGMEIRTVLLVDDLKNELGITTKTDFSWPEKPVKPQSNMEGDGDNSCSDCFTYEKNGNYYTVTGLTEKGATQKELIVPYQVDGYYITEFTKDVFYYNKTIEKITIQDNIKRIYDSSFFGCDSLKGIYLEQTDPALLSVGFNLLLGTSANIYVDNNAKSGFVNNYFWGAYQERIKGYEKD